MVLPQARRSSQEKSVRARESIVGTPLCPRRDSKSFFVKHEVTMSVSRRKFLQNSALVAIGYAANPLFAGSGHGKTSGSGKDGPQTAMLPAPQRQIFANAIGSSFQVS